MSKSNVKEFYTNFLTSAIKKKKDLENEILYNLYKKSREKKIEMPSIQAILPNVVQQADLLYLPNDDGFKYCLTLVDVGSRLFDAVPLKDRTSKAVLDGFKILYKQRVLHLPARTIQFDSGTEFKDKVKKYFEEQGINIRVSQTGRHRQQALIEARNLTLGKALMMRMSAEELITHEPSRDWVEFLPCVVKAMNKHFGRKLAYIKKLIKKQDDAPYTCSGKNCELIPVGTPVRFALDEPVDTATN